MGLKRQLNGFPEIIKKQLRTKLLKKIAIIGGNGVLGSDLVRHLGPFFSITSITRDNYDKFAGLRFDAVINANGNSRRYWANQNPKDDFFASTVSVYKSIFDFLCEKYIYISSPDVYENHASIDSTRENQEINPQNLQSYGFHKYLSELIVKKHKEKFIILRSSMVLGMNLKKGPIYDIMHDSPVFVTSQTRLQLITTSAISEIIKILLDKEVINQIINMGGIGTFEFSETDEYFHKKIKTSPQAETQLYEMNVEKLKTLYSGLKTSKEYLKDFLAFHS